MKTLKFIALLLTALTSCVYSDSDTLQEKKEWKPIDPFSAIDYDKAVAYDFDGDTDILLLDSSNQLTKTVTKQTILDSSQIAEFKNIIMDSTTFGAIQPKDFYPHFGIIFYKYNKIIHSLQISLTCSGMIATFPIQELNKREYPENGLTEKGRERIYYFCKRLGFKQKLGSNRDFEYQPTQ